MKKHILNIKGILTAILAVAIVLGACVFSSAANGFKYKHDPRQNPSAMEDIVEDDEAIYGFRPSETGSLKMYAEYDWTDPDVVESGRQDRIEYHKSVEALYEELEKLTAEGKSIEETARAISKMRNDLRLSEYENDPEGLAAIKARNFEKYGHEEGPLPDELYEKYGSWEMVLTKAFSLNSGMDACLGLYDDYYYVYVAAKQVEPDEPEKADRSFVPVIIIATVAVASAANAFAVFALIRAKKRKN